MQMDPQRGDDFRALYSLLEAWSATTTRQGSPQLTGDLVEEGDHLLLLNQGRR